MKLAAFWLSIMDDPTRRDSDRLEASKLLADRGWGKAAVVEPQDGDPLDLASAEQAAEEFRTKILPGLLTIQSRARLSPRTGPRR
jgi:hypothetical protein